MGGLRHYHLHSVGSREPTTLARSGDSPERMGRCTSWFSPGGSPKQKEHAVLPMSCSRAFSSRHFFQQSHLHTGLSILFGAAGEKALDRACSATYQKSPVRDHPLPSIPLGIAMVLGCPRRSTRPGTPASSSSLDDYGRAVN